MPDIIRLLPDAVANQIAAGEVIQRPASVVKELMENALDAGATDIQVIIKDSGKTLIQVIDNGCGMSAPDARMCFERHATSKIRNANDLFSIRTMGFRGEAMASVAAVAEVELKTKRQEDETGSELHISASKLMSQELCNCSPGTSIAVRNLFFNVPARRKFLKSDQAEFRHIVEEFQRIAIPCCDIRLKLVHNGTDILQLEPSNLRQRIVSVFGKAINQHLIPINIETSIVSVEGFIGKPDKTRKTPDEQYFFVNKRFMLHPYFRKAVMLPYEGIIMQSTYPSFFIFLQVDPSHIDINIHPTKTEIKFDEEKAVFQILNASVKESLGKFNIVAPLAFEEDITKDVHLTSRTEFRLPEIKLNPDYNPFDKPNRQKEYYDSFNKNFAETRKPPANWEMLFDTEKKQPQGEPEKGIESVSVSEDVQFLQIKDKYIITPVKSGLMIIDQGRAHERILYEEFLSHMVDKKATCQKSLFPEQIELSATDRALLTEVMEDLCNIGFDISFLGKSTIAIHGVPSALTDINPCLIFKEFFQTFNDMGQQLKLSYNEKLAYSIAKTTSLHSPKQLSSLEQKDLFFRLMLCKNHNFTPDGKKIMEIVAIDEIEKKLN
ncbi:MAG TPA: DNA mismatch repair endonuclease MutL [Bacteroidales bacterium]|nr:DNA mismatch repair endonuclease MutL [Bacteroidales bacterium]